MERDEALEVLDYWRLLRRNRCSASDSLDVLMTLRDRAQFYHSFSGYIAEGEALRLGYRFLVWHSGLGGTQYELRRGMFGKAIWRCFVACASPSVAEQSCKRTAYSGVRRARHNLLARVSRAREVAVPGQTKG